MKYEYLPMYESNLLAIPDVILSQPIASIITTNPIASNVYPKGVGIRIKLKKNNVRVQYLNSNASPSTDVTDLCEDMPRQRARTMPSIKKLKLE
jgi:hypothetical protein